MKARCPLHVNVTAALLDTLSDMQEQMARIFAELDAENFRRRVEVLRAAQTAAGTGSDGYQPSSAVGSGKDRENAGGGDGGGKRGTPGRQDSAISRYRHREVVKYPDVFCTPWPTEDAGGDGDGESKGDQGWAPGVVNTPRFPVCHEFCAPLPLESRMSFTILNLTGQRTRYFQPRAGEETRRLQYLRVRTHNERSAMCSLTTLTWVACCETCPECQRGWVYAGCTGASLEPAALVGDFFGCPCLLWEYGVLAGVGSTAFHMGRQAGILC